MGYSLPLWVYRHWDYSAQLYCQMEDLSKMGGPPSEKFPELFCALLPIQPRLLQKTEGGSASPVHLSLQPHSLESIFPWHMVLPLPDTALFSAFSHPRLVLSVLSGFKMHEGKSYSKFFPHSSVSEEASPC